MGDSALEVYTLGKFLVRKGEHTLSEHKSQSSKVWDIFQYFLSTANDVNSPEQIFKDLNFDMELMDAKNVLENRIYRLRKVLAVGEEYKADQYIYYRNGGYGLRRSSFSWIDFEIFQENCKKGKKLVNSGKKMDAIECLLSALNIYQGDYLTNQLNPHWAVAPRVQYRELYLESLDLLCKMLSEHEEYQKIEELCRRAVKIEPFEEHFHYILLETFLKRGYRHKARQHYALVQTLFSQQGVEFFPELGKRLNESNSSHSRFAKGIFNLDQIKKEIYLNNSCKEVKIISAQLFHDFAEYLYKFSQRYEEKLYLASVAVEFSHNDVTEADEEYHINSLLKIFQKNLRSYDIICKWTDQQYLILLSSIQERKVIDILERIKDRYYEAGNQIGAIINTSYRIL